MAYPTISGVTSFGSNTAQATWTFTYPAVSNGDLLIVTVGNDGTGDSPVFSNNGGGNWLTNQLFAESFGGHGGGATYHICDGTETGTFTVGCSTGSEEWAGNIIHITSWHGTTAPEVGSRVTDNGNDTPASSLTPAGWDSSADDTSWIWGFTTDGSTITVETFPTEMVNNQTNNNPGGAAPNQAVATANSTVGTFTASAGTNNLSAFEPHAVWVIGVRGGADNPTIAVPMGPLR